MSADGMCPSYPYSNDNMGYDRPSYSPSGYASPMRNGFQQELFPNQTGSRGFFKTPRAAAAGFQSASPSIAPNSNTQLNRPHFDEQ